MAVPKRKTSKSRHRKRFAHWLSLPAVHLIRCRHCNEQRKPHEVCPYCGYYKGRQVTEPRLQSSS